jgi:hypothetical protein
MLPPTPCIIAVNFAATSFMLEEEVPRRSRHCSSLSFWRRVSSRWRFTPAASSG